MPGENPLPTQYYEDDKGFVVFGPYDASDLSTDNPLWLTDDRDIVIDKITLRASVDASIATAIAFEYEAAGVAAGAGTAITDGLDINGAGNATAIDMVLATDASGRPDENVIPGNSVINMNVGSAATSLVGLFIHIRYRSKRR